MLQPEINQNQTQLEHSKLTLTFTLPFAQLHAQSPREVATCPTIRLVITPRSHIFEFLRKILPHLRQKLAVLRVDGIT